MGTTNFVEGMSEELRSKIKWIQIRARSLVSDAFAGQYESAFKGRGMEFEEVREYTPGDDIRHIDWNVTARMDRPFIKLHRDERDMTVMFLVDVSGSTLFGSGDKFKNEIAAEVTALLAYSALRNQDKTGLIVFSDHVEHFLPPKKSRGHIWRVIRDVLSHRAKSGRTDLRVPLDFMNTVLKKKAVVFLISDFQGVTLPPQLRSCAKKHDLLAVSIRDPREIELPRVGYLHLEDAETGQRTWFNTNNELARKRYQELAVKSRQTQRDFFASAGIDRIEIDTQTSYIEPIMRCFLRREGYRG
jgi:uncharacterized protein (DUF58 family)